MALSERLYGDKRDIRLTYVTDSCFFHYRARPRFDFAYTSRDWAIHADNLPDSRSMDFPMLRIPFSDLLYNNCQEGSINAFQSLPELSRLRVFGLVR